MSTLSTLKCRFSVSPSYGLLEELDAGAGDDALAGVEDGEASFARWAFFAFSASTPLRHLVTISLASLATSLSVLALSLPTTTPALVACHHRVRIGRSMLGEQ